jgi:hypothetical protein
MTQVLGAGYPERSTEHLCTEPMGIETEHPGTKHPSTKHQAPSTEH